MNYVFPSTITAGTTVIFTKVLADYPAGDWTLTYYLRGPGTGFDSEAVADGSNHLVTFSVADTGNLTAGTWYFRALVTDGTETHCVDEGEFKVKAAFGSVSDVHDNRSQAKIILDAIDAMIQGTASLNQKRYQINNRELERYDMTDLIAMRTYWANIVARETQAERLRDGKTFFKTIHTRFKNPV